MAKPEWQPLPGDAATVEVPVGRALDVKVLFPAMDLPDGEMAIRSLRIDGEVHECQFFPSGAGGCSWTATWMGGTALGKGSTVAVAVETSGGPAGSLQYRIW